MGRIKGFSIIEIVMVLGVVVLMAGVGFVGWSALTKSNEITQDAASVSPSKTIEVITTKADLELAETELDELNFDDESSTEAETQAGL